MADEYRRTCYGCGSSNPRAAMYCAWCGVRTREAEPFEESGESEGSGRIVLERATVMKLRRQKAYIDNEQSACPDHTIDSYVNYLLDTERAARNGRVSDSPCESDTDPPESGH